MNEPDVKVKVERLEVRIDGMDAVLRERKEASDKALALAVNALEVKLDHLNHLRTDAVTRGEWSKAHEFIMADVRRLEVWQNKAAGIGMVLILFSGVVGVVIGKLWK